MPVLRWPGATARYSHFNVPVETGTPPHRRSKLRIIRFRLKAESSFTALLLLSKPDPLRWAPVWSAAAPLVGKRSGNFSSPTGEEKFMI